jgi:hypothetical protein
MRALRNYARPIRWDAARSRYRDPRGRFVAWGDVEADLRRGLDAAEGKVREITQALREGRTPLAVWQRQMQAHVRSVHVVQAAIARGGIPRLTADDTARIRATIKRELTFLDARAAKVASGVQRLDGLLTERAKMYVRAGRETWHQERRMALTALGFDEEHNIQGVGDHCTDCPALTDREWVPIGTLPLVGTRSCVRNCNCKVKYRRTSDGEEMDA